MAYQGPCDQVPVPWLAREAVLSQIRYSHSVTGGHVLPPWCLGLCVTAARDPSAALPPPVATGRLSFPDVLLLFGLVASAPLAYPSFPPTSPFSPLSPSILRLPFY